MTKIRIPENLRNENFRFVLLEKETKRPFEKNWTTENNYKFDDPKLLKHIEEVGNYGVLGGPGGLVILDLDAMDLVTEIEALLPSTFTVETGSGKKHYYFIVDTPEKIILDKGDIHVGEIQGPGAQCVGPSSIHPLTKKEYKIVSDIPVSKLETTIVKYIKDNYSSRIFKVQSPKWEQYRTTNISEQLNIMSLIDTTKFKKHGIEVYGEHPIHGSTTGMNFFVNPIRNLWHCFRHVSGGDALAYLSMKEGICNCEDFGLTGKKLRGADFVNTIQVAKEKHGLKFDVTQFAQMPQHVLANYDITAQMLEQINIDDIEVVRGDEVMHLKIKAAEWLIEKLMPAHALSFLAGKSGSYKSITALHMAIAIAEGMDVFHRYKTQREPVLYLNEENTWQIFKPFVEAVYKGLGIPEGSRNIHFCTFQGLTLGMKNIQARAKLEKIIKDRGIKVVFFDSFKRFTDFEENDADKVNEFYTFILKPLVRKYELTTAMIHHVRKENLNIKFRVDKKDLLRGSSDLVNIADNILYFERGVHNLMFDLYQVKCRIAEEFETKTIKIIWDPVAGVDFNELTTLADSSKDIHVNECADEILKYIVKNNLEEFNPSQLQDYFQEKYKKGAVYDAINKLAVDRYIEKVARGKYTIIKENPSWLEYGKNFAKDVSPEKKDEQQTLGGKDEEQKDLFFG